MAEFDRVLSEIQETWLEIDGVVSVAGSKDGEKDVILVLVESMTPEIEKQIPERYKGFATKIIESGEIGIQD